MNEQTKRELLAKDRQYVWHPFTQMKDYAERDHVLIDRAEGIYLYDADGNRYIDTVSSWWVNVHGHGHPRIGKAMLAQFEKSDHTMFSGLTHQPGIELAEQLVNITPEGLNKVFYSDNGSTAVEVALKMSFQYWIHKNKPSKSKFGFVENSYHGDTIGTISVGGVEVYHSTFKSLLFPAYPVPSPNVYISTKDAETVVREALEAVRTLFEASAHEIAAFIIEPLIQAAGGMIIYPPSYLVGLRELCTAYDVHLIADEVAVGFGRTGRMFACEYAGISPDLMCLSKGLTAGVIPLSVTMCTDDIYEAFYDDYDTLKTFFHGHSYTGNPIAAAVALESLRIFEEEQVLERMKGPVKHLGEQLQRIAGLKHIGDVRQLGMVAAFQLYADPETRKPFEAHERMGNRVYMEGMNYGLLLRPLGDTIYYWLPLCTTKEQIGDIVDRTLQVFTKLSLA